MNKLTLDLIQANASIGTALVDLMVAAQAAVEAWEKDTEGPATSNAMSELRIALQDK